MDFLKPVAFPKQRIGHAVRDLYSFDTLTKRSGGECSNKGEGQQQERRRAKQHLDDKTRSSGISKNWYIRLWAPGLKLIERNTGIERRLCEGSNVYLAIL